MSKKHKKRMRKKRENRRKIRWKVLKKRWEIPECGRWRFTFISYNKAKKARKALIERDGNYCWICGGLLCPEGNLVDDSLYRTSIDHVIPISEGGCDCLANLKLAHQKCNMKRSENN